MKSLIPCPTVMRQLLDYNKSTGVLLWRERPESFFSETRQGQSPKSRADAWNKANAKMLALNSVKDNGYLYGRVFNKNTYAHRAAWCVYYGSWPSGVIDHINGEKSDNRICNLRDVSKSINGKNTKIRSTNTTGYAGVYLDKRDGKWFSQIRSNGKTVALGRFHDKKDAISARKLAEASNGYM